MPLTELNHYLLVAKNLERTKKFYQDVLGMQLAERPDFGFPGYWLKLGDDICVHLASQAPNKVRDQFLLKKHPKGTTGSQLDALARHALWQVGLDFDHGTGHGVGSYLSVHEGPARISKLGTTALKRGMILSNEPGYYKAEAYGIRIENLVLVCEAAPVAGAEKALNTFETLTLAPLEQRLIDRNMLTAEESAWLDAYHARVLTAPSGQLVSKTRTCVTAASRPLAHA